MSQMQNLNNQSPEFEETIDLKDIWRIIKSNQQPLVVIFGITVLISVILALTTVPVYQATSVIMIKEGKSNARSFVFDMGGGGAAQRLKNEIYVLGSLSLNEKVIDSILKSGGAEQSSLFGTRYVRKRYRLFDYAKSWVNPSELGDIVSLDSLSSIDLMMIAQGLRNSTEISTIRETDVLHIGVKSPDSSEAIYLANQVAEEYQKWDQVGGRGDVAFVLTFLDSQITKYESRLKTLENELREYQTDNQIYSLDGSAELLLKDLTNYEGIYFTNIAELEVAQERVRYLRAQLSESETALMEEITNTNNPMIVALRGKIADLEAQKIQQMVDEGWSEQSLQSRDFNRRIVEMKNKLTNITETLILSGWSEEDPFAASQEIFNKIVEQEVEVYASSSRAKEYKKLVDQMSRRLDQLPDQILNYARLERERRLTENLYLTMKERYEESRITEAGQLGKVRILDKARISAKVKPKKKLSVLMGAFIGLGLGLGYAFLREYLDNTIKSVEQLERKGLTVLGIIPDLHQADGKRISPNAMKPSKGGTDFRRRLITYEDPKSPVSESYRSLRTNIAYASADKKIKSIIVSSAQPGEGKSTTVANIAIAFAQLRKRTLLIDTDMRKPVQHNVFGLERAPGMSEYLIGDIEDVNDVIQPTKIDNLFMITAGGLPPNPSELIGSQRMSELVDRLENEWDMVLFDSPPLVAVTDASMISAGIDAVIMVIKAGSTDRAAVDRALDTLKNVNAPLAGIVLNSVRDETMGGKYSYYYSYYNYYYEGSDGKNSKGSGKK
jgi:capsular exopolysaccharide synthesis family protein